MNVVFDIGRVLLDWDPWHLFRHFFNSRDEFEIFLQETDLPAINLQCDGGLPFHVGVETMKKNAPHHTAPIEAFDARWIETIPGVIQDTVQIMTELQAADIPCYAITNFSAEKWPLAVERFPFLDTFEDAIVSGQVGILKPDAEIYHLLCRNNNLQASECVFIDDKFENVDGARAVGMDAIHFESPAALRIELRERGLPL